MERKNTGQKENKIGEMANNSLTNPLLSGTFSAVEILLSNDNNKMGPAILRSKKTLFSAILILLIRIFSSSFAKQIR